MAAVAEYCKVLGNINPVDPAAPKIKFRTNLPSSWNGKALMFGGGGYNGVLANGLGKVPAGSTHKPAPLARAYVTFASDSGHQANANGSRDGTFGGSDGALKNFAADAIKKPLHAAINIIQTRYAARVQPTVLTLSLGTEQPANPMPAVKPANTTTIATSLRAMDHATVLAAYPHRHGCGQIRQFCPLLRNPGLRQIKVHW